LIKAEGAGNDFIIGIGAWADRLADDPGLVVRLCHRRRGVGADGVLAVVRESDHFIRVVHRNADGSPSAFCANGTRCAARVAVDRLGCESRLAIRTGWAKIEAEVSADAVSLELPAPTRPERLSLSSDLGELSGWSLSVGVPHAVLPVTGLEAVDMERLAGPLRHHRDLGRDGANIHLVEAHDDGTLAVRSVERGVDSEVLCCGSGVVASGLVIMDQTGSRVTRVIPRSGDELLVEALAEPPTCRSRLTGPARLVAEIEPLD
jgi:diaminopimelate epimerase